MNAKLRAEVSNWMFGRDRFVFMLSVRTGGHVRLKTLAETTYTFEVNGICSSFSQSIRRCFRKKLSWIALTLFPDLGIEITKDALAIRGPTPPVIPRQPFKRN